MKRIETSLTKAALTERIESLTYKKVPHGRGYNDKDCFVSKIRGDSFILMYHIRNAGRSDGYWTNVIKANIRERDDGRVDVYYSVRIWLPVIIFASAFTFVPLLLIAAILADWAVIGTVPEWNIIIPAVLAAVGLTLLHTKPKSAATKLTEQLYKICKASDKS